ncbi:MAG: response regulator [Desulfobulbaceae bacterium]
MLESYRKEAGKKKPTIVIVDDEESILKELRILLGRTYDVHVFTNPEEAEVFVDNNEVELVISDEMMPEMRGSVLLGRIHRKHPDICNIVLSGQAEKDDIVRAVNEGHIFSFLYKPTERQQLLNVIEKGLENRNMKLQLAEQNLQLKRYSENLEKMVEEKTAELVKAYDRLNMLDANKMHFLVYLSEEMDSSLDRIHNLAQELLNYFAFAGTEPVLHAEAVSFDTIVEEVVSAIKDDLAGKNIVLEKDIIPGARVFADRDSLERVVRTLVKNGLVFTGEGGKVALSAVREDDRLRFCVQDTGRGIAPENLEKIFQPFMLSREERNPDGFGLNLPRARALITAMGGRIWAESEGPGRGARVCIELPAVS